MMNVEDLRSYCLSLDADVVEKFPFTAFKYAKDVLVFYIEQCDGQVRPCQYSRIGGTLRLDKQTIQRQCQILDRHGRIPG